MAVLRTHRRPVVVGVVLAAIVVAFVIGLLQGGDEVERPSSVPTLAQAQAALVDAPPALARVYADGPRVLDLDLPGVRAWLRGLRGRPVVINSWYPDCAPCREEFPLLRRAAADYGTQVAFVGLIRDGSDADVATFLRGEPTVYPHVRDRDDRLARELQAGQSYPSTIVLDARGRVATVYSGAFPSLGRLERVLRDYAGVTPRRAAATTTAAGPTTTGGGGR
jgi:cytochrome c biogenesis protein CcmG/thiol:disulfide interchange protein DsbE